ncbi:hypothetical protein BV25DRAFT_1774451, partial [Artomyces pyxidatus]
RMKLSYGTMKGLLKKVDELPARAVWKSKNVWFQDRPDDMHLIQYRDPLEAIQALLGNPAHKDQIVYRPSKVFTSRDKKDRVYHEMWSGKWWWAMQVRAADGHDGATVAPVILATDKTHLTQHSGNKSAYPVYLTLGNIARSVRRKPSQHACVLIAYLSVEKLNSLHMSAQEKSTRGQRLFHDSMRMILEPLVAAGRDGIDMVCADGAVRRVHPILASHVADFPEQCLVTCSKNGTCPKCKCPANDLQDTFAKDPRTQEWTLGVIAEAKESS